MKKDPKPVDNISAYIEEYAQSQHILDQLAHHQFSNTKTLPQAVEDLEREMIRCALCDNTRTGAAKELGISRELLYYKMKKYQIKG